ncbi:MAG TPA: hypothetical protein VJJ51_06355 [Candidatus Methanoperedens sp.]|nr:hypothetical protein [Candidatus Methanoperedens sp.]HLB70650.1 hypothetical protein [Candidatus Methanoperedens sp.]
MSERSIDIALTMVEAGSGMDLLYENVCTLDSDPELCFNYATTHDLKSWGFAEGCFTCFLQDKKDVIIQVITAYRHREGANTAFQEDVDFLKKNDYGIPVKIRTLGEASILFKKKQSDGVTYNLLFQKNTIFAAISTKYKKDMADNVDNIVGLAEKIEQKIPC